MRLLSDRRPLIRNTILSSMTGQDFAALAPLLRVTVIQERMVLQEPGRPVDQVHFIESGLASVRLVASDGMFEAAVAGRRCAPGISCLLSFNTPVYQCVVLFSGTALSVAFDRLIPLLKERPHVAKHLASRDWALAHHCAQSALCAVRHSLEQRVACWICTACDALGGVVLPVTHQYLSSALGLRRAGVSEVLAKFQQRSFIRNSRGVLYVDDRKRLAQLACDCCSLISSVYTAVAEFRAPVEQTSEYEAIELSRDVTNVYQ